MNVFIWIFVFKSFERCTFKLKWLEFNSWIVLRVFFIIISKEIEPKTDWSEWLR